MRPIKFRGKRVDNGEWVHGFYYEWRSKKYKGVYQASIHVIEYDKDGLKIKDEQHEVFIESVGQYTDFLDLVGVETYEDDRVIGDNWTGFIHFDNGAFYIKRDNAEGEVEETFLLSNYPFKVTGNIHDNPKVPT